MERGQLRELRNKDKENKKDSEDSHNHILYMCIIKTQKRYM